MRAILLILILGVVLLIAAMATGFLDISQTRQARVPDIESSDGAIRANDGQAPAFDIETGKIELGTRSANVAVPKVEVKRDQAEIAVPSLEVSGAKDSEANAN